MAVALQPDRWKMRGAAGHFVHGRPYTSFAYVERVTGEVAAITGMIGIMHPGMRREIAAELKALGFKRVLWETGDGKVIEHDLERF